MRLWTLLLTLLWGSLGWAQLKTNSIEITASRTLNMTPDQANFDIQVVSGFGASLSDVVNELSPVGITAANFVGLVPSFGTPNVVSTNPGPVWDFNLTVPLSSTPGTLSQLTALAKTAGSGSPLSVYFSLLGVSTSAAGQPACAISDLVADATAQAQTLANAANLRLGPVLAISNQPPATSTVNITLVPVEVGIIDFALGASPTCTATVKFGIVRL